MSAATSSEDFASDKQGGASAFVGPESPIFASASASASASAASASSSSFSKNYAKFKADQTAAKEKSDSEVEPKKLAAYAKLEPVLPFAEQPLVTIATCNLNQWALDYEGNKSRIKNSITLARKANCTYRIGPELEITGYSCEDHFYEIDTMTFAWMSLRDIIADGFTDDILCDFGMPILHNGVRYNCRVFVLNREILLIRPKMWMADDGNYREDRHFTPWSKHKMSELEDFSIPEEMWDVLHASQTFRTPAASGSAASEHRLNVQKTAPFGIGIVQCRDASIGAEVCEELFTAESMNIYLGFEGVDIMSNGSASHFQLGKRNRRHELIKEATKKNGGIYMYSNMLGCDGNRMAFDGNGMIYMNGELKAVGEHLSFHEVEVVTATLNLNDVRTYRATSVSHQIQSDQRSIKLPRVNVDFKLCRHSGIAGDFNITQSIDSGRDDKDIDMGYAERPQVEKEFLKKTPESDRYFKEKSMIMEEEMGLAIARYVWDYLNRSNAGGFMLPLSGGVDSSSTALMIYFMCSKVLSFMKPTGTAVAIDKLTAKETFEQQQVRLRDIIIDKIYRKLSNYPEYDLPQDANKVDFLKTNLTTEKLMNVLLHTVNLPTNNNSSQIKWYAYDVARDLGCFHMTVPINDAFVKLREVVKDMSFGSDPVEKAKKDHEKINVPRYASEGGDNQENLAIQNIQARLRMVTPYYLSQIIPIYRYNQEVLSKIRRGKEVEYGTITWKEFHEQIPRLSEEWTRNPANEGKPFDLKTALEEAAASDPEEKAKYKAFYDAYIIPRGKLPFLLVLASSNSDEALRGFYTKYDASSADLNPIGSFSKKHLRRFLKWAATDNEMFGRKFSVINEILQVTASPELTPPSQAKAGELAVVQNDENDIKMTYEDLYEFGLLRKRYHMGPISMFYALCKQKLGGAIVTIDDTRNPVRLIEAATPTNLARKLEIFLGWYGANRNKMPILTPSIHATDYSPDDNRYDQRPFLYPSYWGGYQINVVYALAKKMESRADVRALVEKGVEVAKEVGPVEFTIEKKTSEHLTELYNERQLELMSRPPVPQKEGYPAPRAINFTGKEFAGARALSAARSAPKSATTTPYARKGGRRVTRNKAREQRRRTAKFGNLN